MCDAAHYLSNFATADPIEVEHAKSIPRMERDPRRLLLSVAMPAKCLISPRNRAWIRT